MAELARLAVPGGRIVLVDTGLPADENRLGSALARLWQRACDFLYDLLKHRPGSESSK